MMREVNVQEITDNIKEMCIEANHFLTDDMKNVFEKAAIKESPVNIECKVTQVLELGSHDMFLAKVECVRVDESLLDEKGTLHLDKADLVAYSHGSYYSLGDFIGKFGYSVKKKGR